MVVGCYTIIKNKNMKPNKFQRCLQFVNSPIVILPVAGVFISIRNSQPIKQWAMARWEFAFLLICFAWEFHITYNYKRYYYKKIKDDEEFSRI